LEELHAAVGGSHFTLTEVKHVLQSTDTFVSEPTLWFADSDSYQSWLRELWLQMNAERPSDRDVPNRASQQQDAIQSEDEDEFALYTGPAPREWQIRALNLWIESDESGIVEAVTGTGKTLVGILAAARAVYYEEKVVICVPTLVLLRQWVDKLTEYLPDASVGELHGSSKDSIEEYDIIVTTAQSALAYETIAEGQPTILIADEVHGLGAPARQAILDPAYTCRLGLTATLERDNDEGVEEFILPYFGSTVFSYAYPDGLTDGVLAPFKIGFFGVDFLPGERQEYDELGSEMGRLRHRLEERGLKAKSDKELFGKIALLSKDKSADFQDMRLAQKFMSNLSQRKTLQATARNKIEAIEKLAHPLNFSTRGLVFTETIDSAASITALLNGLNVRSHSFDSSNTSDERQTILNRYAEGHYRVLCAPRVLDEGVDVPDADVGVIVAASRSRRQMIQRMGRIVRPNAGGHPSTFFIMYLKGTREDPKMGAHEGFLTEVEPHATEVAYFDLRESGPGITTWMYSDR
jgi:RNA polymerase primary sigma factor